MAVRNRQELIDRAAVLFPTEGDPLITAQELRSFILDLVDSLAFAEAVTGAAIVELINTQLRQTDWQNATVGGSGITLAQAIAAVRIDATPVGTLELSRDDSDPTRVVIGLQFHQVHVETRYAAQSPDPVFSEVEWAAGNTSTDDTIIFPVIGTLHRRGFAIPASEASLTDIRVVGSPFNERGSYAPPIGDADVLADIGGESHKTYIRTSDSAGNINLSVAARTFQLR